MDEIIKHSEYHDWLRNLKQQIKTGQVKAALSVKQKHTQSCIPSGMHLSVKTKTRPKPCIPLGMQPINKHH